MGCNRQQTGHFRAHWDLDRSSFKSRMGRFWPGWALREVYPSAAEGSGLTKAVSDRFISAAMSCMTSSERSFSWMHTAAGFPENLLVVNASTCMKLRKLSPMLEYSFCLSWEEKRVPGTIARILSSQYSSLARGSVLNQSWTSVQQPELILQKLAMQVRPQGGPLSVTYRCI